VVVDVENDLSFRELLVEKTGKMLAILKAISVGKGNNTAVPA